MQLQLSVNDGAVCRRFDSGTLNALGRAHVASGDGAKEVAPLEALQAWADRYARASVRNTAMALREIGTEMFAWLDTANALQAWMQQGERVLHILPDPQNSAPELAEALIAAPWELLHHEAFLAQHPSQLFVVSRRMVAAQDQWQPRHGDLRMMFMAAAPEGQSDLDYEREEADIINATQGIDGQRPLAHLVVEESGALEFLAPRLNGSDGDFEALHLSCHGDIVAPKDADGHRAGETRPILLLEGADGEAHEVSAPDLISTCQNTLPPLVFLSACRTAQRGGSDMLRGAEGFRREGFSEAATVFDDTSTHRDDGSSVPEPHQAAATPYVLELVRSVPNVVGWDGSVYDHDASAFATTFYGALSDGKNVPVAAAMARRTLLVAQSQDPQNGRHWHLARVYLGAAGGGAICQPGLQKRDPPPPEPEYLDSENRIRVAGRDTFVGRRRVIQTAIAAMRAGPNAVLAQGIGNLGKSSLAARIGARLTGHRTVAVVSTKPGTGAGDAGARVIFAKLKAAVEAMAADLPYGDAKATSLRNQVAAMETDLAEYPDRFEAILSTLLAGPFKDQPIFLVLDDFENSLETPTAEAPIPQPRASLLPALQAVFRAFSGPLVTSRLMVTCRYDFTVPEGQGHDLTQPFLKRLPLNPMSPREQSKQWQARDRARKTEEGETATEIDRALVARIQGVAQGNPGLQEVLSQPLLRGATDEVEAALETIEAFLDTGATPPPGEDVGDFFQRMTFEVYEGALTGTTRLALSVAAVFSPGVTVPCDALTAGFTAMGIDAPDPALDKLLALGLLDDHGPQAGWRGMTKLPHAAVNPLARPLATEPLDEDEIAHIAGAALPVFAQAWQDANGEFPLDLRAVETCVQALRAPEPDAAMLDEAAGSAVFFLFQRSQNAPAAVALAAPVFAKLDLLNHKPSALLLGHSISAAERVGAVELQDRLLDAALGRSDIEDGFIAQLKGLHANRLVRLGDLDGALRVCEEDLLPVYESLGDKHAVALAKGKIADIFQRRGELDGALRIRVEEELPVYEALGDQRSVAVTKGQIADILQLRGDLDGALRIRVEDELPVYKALGDKRSIAVTKGKIADILQRRGDLDGALRIREEDQIPVYKALGDRRSVAVTQGKIADILQQLGDLDGALRIREQDQLPAFEALGDVREITITKGRVADILQKRGDLDGAMALQQERAAVAEEMQLMDSVVHSKFAIAQIRLMRGEHETDGFKIIFEDLDAAFRGAMQMGRPDAISAVGALLAQVLAAAGAKTPALEVLDLTRQAYETLKDAKGLARIVEIRELIEHLDADDPSVGD